MGRGRVIRLCLSCLFLSLVINSQVNLFLQVGVIAEPEANRNPLWGDSIFPIPNTLYEPQILRSEDQIELFPNSFRIVEHGKIVSG
jgi:hypothetical protein